jgi:dCMP deaminase
MERESWDEYFLRMAHAVASRSTCLRLQVGAVLVQDKSVRGTGYNGAPRGVTSCLEAGECHLRHGRCARSVHAEANVILQSDADERRGGTVYVTAMPCWNCALLLSNSGISEVVYDQTWGRESAEVEELFREARIHLRRLPLDLKS